jgi:hypothetical protein
MARRPFGGARRRGQMTPPSRPGSGMAVRAKLALASAHPIESTHASRASATNQLLVRTNVERDSRLPLLLAPARSQRGEVQQSNREPRCASATQTALRKSMFGSPVLRPSAGSPSIKATTSLKSRIETIEYRWPANSSINVKKSPYCLATVRYIL